MKQLFQKLKTRKIFIILFSTVLLSFLLGIFYVSILGDDNQKLIETSLSNFFNSITKHELNYQKAFFISTTNHVIASFFIWLIGISIIGIPFIILILGYKSFLLGFSLASIIYHYHLLGTILGMIYIIPHVISLFAFFVLSYYAVSFSMMLFNLFFRKKDYNRKVIMKRYIKILVLTLLLSLISIIMEVFLVPILLDFIL